MCLGNIYITRGISFDSNNIIFVDFKIVCPNVTKTVSIKRNWIL